MSRIMFGRAGLMAATAMALTLAACNKSPAPDNGSAGINQSADANGTLPALPAAVPLQQGSATPIAAAPAATALPAAAPVKVAQVAQPTDAYAYLDRANGVMDAIGDAPPDYAYDDGDVSPWAWRTGNGDVQYAEPVDGGYRYYYYEPGANAPYLVRDPSHSYAYSNGQLVAVYDDRGALLPSNAYRDRVDYASRYYARAAYLHRLSQERAHRGVVAANWAARRSEIARARDQWADNRVRQAEWQAYHQAHERQDQDHWADERRQRQAEAQHFDQWQREGFHNPPPGRPGGSAGDQQPRQRADQDRHDGDQRGAQDRQRHADDPRRDDAQRQHDRDQATRDRAQDLQHDRDQHVAARQQQQQRAADDRRQVIEDRQHAQADAREDHTEAARQQQDRAQAQADAHAHAQAEQAHEQAAARNQQAAEHAHAGSRAPEPHPPGPHPEPRRGGEGPHHHD